MYIYILLFFAADGRRLENVVVITHFNLSIVSPFFFLIMGGIHCSDRLVRGYTRQLALACLSFILRGGYPPSPGLGTTPWGLPTLAFWTVSLQGIKGMGAVGTADS